MPGLRIGCSGFTYQHWKGVFYPERLATAQWFEHYCSFFSTVELNVTFYRLPPPKTYEAWYKKSPSTFGFSLKGSRFITHVKKLIDPKEGLARFFDGALRLQNKLMVVLWQFPPSFEIHAERLKAFLKLLTPYPVRNTLEFRNQSWISPPVLELCREHHISLCMADWPHYLDELPATADFVYIRRHGKQGNYATCYAEADLQRDAVRIRKYLQDGKDVFIYFNNDFQGHAPNNARNLAAMLA